jgi:hypothetical protein
MPSARKADTKAAELQSQNWKGTATDGSDTKLFIGGEFVASKTDKWIDVHDPVRVYPSSSTPFRSQTDRVELCK